MEVLRSTVLITYGTFEWISPIIIIKTCLLTDIIYNYTCHAVYLILQHIGLLVLNYFHINVEEEHFLRFYPNILSSHCQRKEHTRHAQEIDLSPDLRQEMDRVVVHLIQGESIVLRFHVIWLS